jgi:hypothetical protein
MSLYPTVVLDPTVAMSGPNLAPSGSLITLPLDMSVVLMKQIIVAQLSLTEDFSLRAWVSIYPNGISLITPAWPDTFALSRMTPRPLVLYVRGQIPPDETILVPVVPGQYYLNILNLTNQLNLFGFTMSDLA